MTGETNYLADLQFREIYTFHEAVAAFRDAPGFLGISRSFAPFELERLSIEFLGSEARGDRSEQPDAEELQREFFESVDVEAAIAAGWDDKSESEKDLYRCFMFGFETEADRDQFVERASESDAVAIVGPHIPMELFAPTDPESNRGQWALDKIAPADVWRCAKGDEVLVAVVDTGIDITHGDLTPNHWSYRSGALLTGPPTPVVTEYFSIGWNALGGFFFGSHQVDDRNGHGTHVAGIVAGQDQNRHGMSGVAPNARILSIRSFDNSGAGGLGPVFSTPNYAASIYGPANGIAWARRFGADVINCSWGATIPGPPGAANSAAIGYATAHGVASSGTEPAVLVFSAGNANVDIAMLHPQNDSRVITVAATDASDSKAGFSNFGTDVDVAAPGVQILSAQTRHQATPLGNEHELVTLSGTSMAAPHVAGMVALIKQHHPDLDFRAIRDIVRTYVAPVNSADPIGSGRIDLTHLAEILCGCGCGPCDLRQTLLERQLKNAAAQKEFDVPSIDGCVSEKCVPLVIEPRIKPCFTLHWGDSPRDILETDDREILYITARNPYSNVTMHGLTINQIRIVPNQVTPNGEPSVELAASELICYDHLSGCESATREYALLTRNAIPRFYRLEFDYCIDQIELHAYNHGEDAFEIELIDS